MRTSDPILATERIPHPSPNNGVEDYTTTAYNGDTSLAAEAVQHFKVPLNRIDVLNVGTMGNEVDFSQSLGKGKAGWVPANADLFFAAQERAARMLADGLLTLARHLRVNQQTPTEIKLDDKEAIEDMALRGANVGQDSFVLARSRFLDGPEVDGWR